MIKRFTIVILFCIMLIYQFQIFNEFSMNSHNSLNSSKVILISGGGSLPEIKHSRDLLLKHFPDWQERIDFEYHQSKLYLSGIKRIEETKRIRVLAIRLTPEEQYAFDYYAGKKFYIYYQNLDTPQNIFDTRMTFLLKMEKNPEMLEKFLNSLNRRKKDEIIN